MEMFDSRNHWVLLINEPLRYGTSAIELMLSALNISSSSEITLFIALDGVTLLYDAW